MMYDEESFTICTGYRSENITRIEGFAIRLVKLGTANSASWKMGELNKNIRTELDYFKLQQILKSHVEQNAGGKINLVEKNITLLI